jgi:hypothetical protein
MSISAACGRRGPAPAAAATQISACSDSSSSRVPGCATPCAGIEDAGFFHHVARLDAGRFSMKATLDSSSAVTVPAAMAAALSALNCST